MSDTNDNLQSLLDERAILRQLHNYCRAMDRCDRELCDAVFHSDCTVDYGEKMYQGPAQGLIDWTFDAHQALTNHMHRVTNSIIEINGWHAGSETYVHAHLRMPTEEGAVDLYNYGRYLDRWEKRDGRWAITHRRYVHEMGGQYTVEGDHYGCQGLRDRTDGSYQTLLGG